MEQDLWCDFLVKGGWAGEGGGREKAGQYNLHLQTKHIMADPALRAEIAKGAALNPAETNDRSAPNTGT